MSSNKLDISILVHGVNLKYTSKTVSVVLDYKIRYAKDEDKTSGFFESLNFSYSIIPMIQEVINDYLKTIEDSKHLEDVFVFYELDYYSPTKYNDLFISIVAEKLKQLKVYNSIIEFTLTVGDINNPHDYLDGVSSYPQIINIEYK